MGICLRFGRCNFCCCFVPYGEIKRCCCSDKKKEKVEYRYLVPQRVPYQVVPVQMVYPQNNVNYGYGQYNGPYYLQQRPVIH